MKEEKSSGSGNSTSYTVSAVDRALQLLLVLAEMPDSGVTELADQTGSTKSLTFRLLFTLEQRGFVRKDPNRRTYALGYRALSLGDHTRRQSQLILAAEPYLDELSLATRENVLLSIRENLHGMCVSMRTSPRPLQIFAAIGRLVPLHVGGGPKVLLAFAPEEVRQQVFANELKAITETSISDPDALEQTLEQIRHNGYAISVGELDPDVFSIAAPVRDLSGEVVAALSVNGPTSRLDEEERNKVRDAVLSASLRLSSVLGWRGTGGFPS